jgi:hypothetical protein
MKAQFWSFDIVFAIVIFVIALALITYVWSDISNQFSLSYGNGVSAMQLGIQGLSTTLTESGNPSNWNSVVNVDNISTWNNVSIGLEGSSGLSTSKILTLEAMSEYNYQDTKPLLGVGYDYYITLTNGEVNITIGKNPGPYNPTSVQVVNIPVLLNNQHTNMHIELWTNTTFGIS